MSSGSEPESSTLPRLLYLGDVPVAFAMSGSILLYRLFDTYPSDKLLIVERGAQLCDASERLEGAHYHLWRRGLTKRFQRISVWAKLCQYWAYRSMTAPDAELDRIIDEFRPDAVVTVSHGVGFLRAHHVAKQRALPLHLMLHDDWFGTFLYPKGIAETLQRTFIEIYRDAKSRFCVSRAMEQYYQNECGVPGTVMYPLRSRNVVGFQDRTGGLENKSADGMVAAFAGGVAYPEELLRFAEVLAEKNGKLIIYGIISEANRAKFGLNIDNIEVREPVPSHELVELLSKIADFLYLPMSFNPARRLNMIVGFPSKLADYTITGLPILFHGPEYCSAVSWCREFQAGEVVTSMDSADIAQAIDSLREPDRRSELARRAGECGNELFAWEAVQQKFREAIADSSNIEQ